MPLHHDKVASIGECMVELARTSDGTFSLAVGGDTYNSAIYMARLGANMAYLTAVGDDPYSNMIITKAAQEGIDTSAIVSVAGRMPGLYVIETENGERTFWYWRDTSPARQVLELNGAEGVIERLLAARWIYLSGITLSLYSEAALDQLSQTLSEARSNGATVAMDSNYRPRGWTGDPKRAQATFARFWALADIALPTFDDEQMLWGDEIPSDTIRRLSDHGVGEICIKNGPEGALLFSAGENSHVPCPEVKAPVDTTAAGDSFNAAYLCARIAGRPPAGAAEAGHRLAAIVIAHRGAITPHEATAGFEV